MLFLDLVLAYLGKVEKDVLQINCELKTLRESRQEDKLAIVVIKKELAEREVCREVWRLGLGIKLQQF